jgi:hypothetical protein
MKYGSRSDIFWLILGAANGIGATKINLIYRAYLPLNQQRDIGITFLIRWG